MESGTEEHPPTVSSTVATPIRSAAISKPAFRIIRPAGLEITVRHCSIIQEPRSGTPRSQNGLTDPRETYHGRSSEVRPRRRPGPACGEFREDRRAEPEDHDWLPATQRGGGAADRERPGRTWPRLHGTDRSDHGEPGTSGRGADGALAGLCEDLAHDRPTHDGRDSGAGGNTPQGRQPVQGPGVAGELPLRLHQAVLPRHGAVAPSHRP